VWVFRLARSYSRSVFDVGVWRSLVAHTLGVRVVAGSNPATPTKHEVVGSKPIPRSILVDPQSTSILQMRAQSYCMRFLFALTCFQ